MVASSLAPAPRPGYHGMGQDGQSPRLPDPERGFSSLLSSPRVPCQLLEDKAGSVPLPPIPLSLPHPLAAPLHPRGGGSGLSGGVGRWDALPLPWGGVGQARWLCAHLSQVGFVERSDNR